MQSYTPEQDAFILKNARKMTFAQMGKVLNLSDEQVRGRYRRLTDGSLNSNSTKQTTNDNTEQKPTLSREMVDGIVNMYNNGHEVKHIASVVGLAAAEVSEVVRSAEGINLKNRMTKLADLDVIEALNRQVSEQQEVIADLTQQATRVRTFIQALGDSVKSIPLPKPVSLPKVKWEPSTTPLIQVAISSDHHAEETVDLEAMEGFNEFNFQIYQERMWYWAHRVIRLGMLRRHEAPIDELHIDLIGDILTGEIHDELVWTNQMRTPKAITRIAIIVAQCLMMFTAYYPKVRVTCIVGNHGRASKKFHFKQAIENSFDTAIYEIAKIYCREAVHEGKIIFDIPQSLKTTVKRFDYTFLLEHGTGIKMNYGTPYYGIDREKQREHNKRFKTDKDFDFFELGHFHQQGKMCNTIMNGSVIGAGEFSSNALADNQPASQAVFFVHEKYGIRSFEEIPLQFGDHQGHGFSMDPLD